MIKMSTDDDIIVESLESKIDEAVKELRELREKIVKGEDKTHILCCIDHIIGFTLQ